MEIKWLLVDFDNTQMDTEAHSIPVLVERFNDIYKQHIRKPLTVAHFQHHFHGMSGKILCERLSEYVDCPVDQALLFQDREKIMQAYYQGLPNGVKMAPGLIEALTECRSQQMTLALVTNNPLQRAFAAMRVADNGQGTALARLFDANYFEANPIQKPNPDVYLRALAHLKADVTQSIAIEDSPTGVLSATNAGITTYGYVGLSNDPITLEQRLMDTGCKATFKHWSELPSLLFR